MRGEQFARFIDAIDDSEKRTLYAMHVVLPHVPWAYLRSGRKYYAPLKMPGVRADQWSAEEAPRALGLQRHLLQAGFVDHLLGRLLDRLQANGVYERSLVVVLADHGASFLAGADRRVPGANNVQDIARVPLFVKRPHQREAAVSERNVEAMDVLPTIADALGVELLWPVDGTSAFGADGERRSKVVYESRHGTSFEFASELAELPPIVAQKTRWFGRGARWPQVEALGPAPQWLGRSIAELGSAAATGLRVRIDDAAKFERVAPDEEFLPCYVAGEVRSDGTRAPPEAIAIAINGVVRATAETFERDGSRAAFAAMVPEECIAVGRNEVAVLELVGEARAVVLARESD
jgi:hypothetical protein